MEKRHKDAGFYFSNLYIHAFSLHLSSGAINMKFASRQTSHRDQTSKHQYTPLDCFSIKNVVQPKSVGQTDI